MADDVPALGQLAQGRPGLLAQRPLQAGCILALAVRPARRVLLGPREAIAPGAASDGCAAIFRGRNRRRLRRQRHPGGEHMDVTAHKHRQRGQQARASRAMHE